MADEVAVVVVEGRAGAAGGVHIAVVVEVDVVREMA